MTSAVTSAIVLFSGGLDSLIAARLLQEQSIDVIGLHIVTPFHNVADVARKHAAMIGIEMVVTTFGNDYLPIIQEPQWGYGKAVNPCIDCRVAMCRAAGDLMRQRGADFVATGEVVGQRPNSQKHHQLDLITRESGLGGRLVRPLSAKALAITPPEVEGVVNRERLQAFSGRARRPLMRIAHALGIRIAPQPSVGCLLCEKSYAPKLRDLFRHTPKPTVWDIDLLNSGRHLRFDATLKVTVARNVHHCEQQEALQQRPDRRPAFLLIPENFFGPSAMLTGTAVERWSAGDIDNVDELTPMRETILGLGGGFLLRFTPPAKRVAPPILVRVLAPDGSDTIEPIAANDALEAYRVIGGD